jgi:nucleotide-binding universal stress UspA family protein
MDSIKTPKDNIILVPIDFSTSSETALEHAVNIANLFDNEITVMHVIGESLLGSLFASGLQKSQVQATVSDRLDKVVDAFKEKHPNLTINKRIVEGKVYKAILDSTEELNCDSIVMGFNGISGVEQFLGSTTSRVLKKSTVPVVIVKDGNTRTNYKNILLPIDLTKESRQKVSWAVHVAKKYDATVHVIMEVEDDEFLRKKVNAALNQVKNILEKNEVKHVCKILSDEEYPDHFGGDVIKYGDEIDADLVMIMTQKETSVREFFLGSFAKDVIKLSNRPVMAINPKSTGTISIIGY